jgi:HJR/Mrr/RecB family endonuclease
MEPLQFEKWVLERLRKQGLSVRKTPRSWDFGADGIAEHAVSGRTLIVQCKHTQTDQLCNEEAIENLIKARTAYQQPDAVIVAVSNAKGYSETASALAHKVGALVIDRGSLAEWPDQIDLV